MWQPWEWIITAIILLNLVAMLTWHANMGSMWLSFMSISNTVFTGIFVAEVALKWLAVSAGRG